MSGGGLIHGQLHRWVELTQFTGQEWQAFLRDQSLKCSTTRGAVIRRQQGYRPSSLNSAIPNGSRVSSQVGAIQCAAPSSEGVESL